MQLSAELSSALLNIEAVKKGIDESDDPKLQMSTAESLQTILELLNDPVFKQIIQCQDSLADLNTQIAQHPSMVPNDFDIDLSGNLVINGPTETLYDDEHKVPSSSNLSPRSVHSPVANGSSPANGAHFLDSLDHSYNTAEKNNSMKRSIHEEERPHSSTGTADRKTTFPDLYSSEMVQIQAIELVNDGSGLGFGIISSRPSGVNVKTILGGGVADRDGRLRSGDHILQIGDVNLHEMGSDQVASVLRQSGTHVRLVVARPIDSILPGMQYDIEPGTAVVPSRYLAHPTDLERYLVETGYPEIFGDSSCASTPQTTTEEEHFTYRSEYITPMTSTAEIPLPETEKFQVELTKDNNGLGITIAGYVCEKEELSGIFVKSVSSGSAADMSGKIQVNDRIIEVDGQSLQGFSNHQAVELLKKSGKIVKLRLERYLRGPKYEQLQQAIAANDKVPSSVPSTPSRSLPPLPISQIPDHVSSEDLSASEIVSDVFSPDFVSEHASVKKLNSFGKKSEQPSKIPKKIIAMEVPLPPPVDDTVDEIETIRHKYYVEPSITTEVESNIIRKWRNIVGPEVEIIVAQLQKLTANSGLGISLEGTVDVEGGVEVRPHHYIRNILPEGPVGRNGKLKSGDELLEVNGQRLLGMNHLEVVAILKELPQDIRMVCSRGQQPVFQSSITMGPLGGSMKKLNSNSNLDNLLPVSSDRLVKAKSDGSLATTSSSVIGLSSVLGGCDPDDSFNNKLKSRSLEPLTGLAMWSSEPQIIELIKGDRGLGFSILDYQDPIDPNDTLIVIRSLVPGGVAQMDGRLIPGDRLLFVNNINLENASLDQAVQALKGAAKGVVKIGVAKPLPMTDNSIKSEQSGISNASTVEPSDGKIFNH